MKNLPVIFILAILSVILMGFVFRNKNAKLARFSTTLYYLIYSLLIGSSGFLGNHAVFGFSNTILYFIFISWFLILGFLHIVFLKKFLPWTFKKSFWPESALSFGIACLGTAFMLVAFHYAHVSVFERIYLVPVLFFLVPFLFYLTYALYLDIPVKVLRKWRYPVDEHIDDPTDREMDSPLVVGFEFKKRANDEDLTSFRAKAPREMVFGKLFYYFINDYNDRNPDEKIEFLDKMEKPYNWIFYHKPGWFGSVRYIDPEDTNSFNFIKENSVIVCKRVIEK
jgi:hypothetical protein